MTEAEITKLIASMMKKSLSLESLFKENAKRIDEILDMDLSTSTTSTVPQTVDVAFNEGKILQTAILFIDMRDSTSLSDGHHRVSITKTYKAFFDCIGKIISNKNGAHIRGYAGDKLMAVFSPADDVCNNAVDAAITIQTGIQHILNPRLQKRFGIKLEYGIGVDYGEIMVGRIGIYGGGSNSDLVWSGDATNFASKLSDFDGAYGSGIRITTTVFNKLTKHLTYEKGGDIWSEVFNLQTGSKEINYRLNTSAYKSAVENI